MWLRRRRRRWRYRTTSIPSNANYTYVPETILNYNRIIKTRPSDQNDYRHTTYNGYIRFAVYYRYMSCIHILYRYIIICVRVMSDIAVKTQRFFFSNRRHRKIKINKNGKKNRIIYYNNIYR